MALFFFHCGASCLPTVNSNAFFFFDVQLCLAFKARKLHKKMGKKRVEKKTPKMLILLLFIHLQRPFSLHPLSLSFASTCALHSSPPPPPLQAWVGCEPPVILAQLTSLFFFFFHSLNLHLLFLTSVLFFFFSSLFIFFYCCYWFLLRCFLFFFIICIPRFPCCSRSWTVIVVLCGGYNTTELPRVKKNNKTKTQTHTQKKKKRLILFD